MKKNTDGVANREKPRQPPPCLLHPANLASRRGPPQQVSPTALPLPARTTQYEPVRRAAAYSQTSDTPQKAHGRPSRRGLLTAPLPSPPRQQKKRSRRP